VLTGCGWGKAKEALAALKLELSEAQRTHRATKEENERVMVGRDRLTEASQDGGESERG
jgi:hypothetical protein